MNESFIRSFIFSHHAVLVGQFMNSRWEMKWMAYVLIISSLMAHAVFADTSRYPEFNESGGHAIHRDNYGEFIARLVSTLYSMETKGCSGAAYQCSGIMVSGFERADDYWMKAFPVQSKISLSFLTKRTVSPQDDVFQGSGFMLWPGGLIKRYSSRDVFEQKFTCAFPTDGGTGYELKAGCGGTPPIQYCQKQHIENASDYLAAYGDLLNRCGFALGVSADKDRSAFETTLQLQDYNIRKKLVYPYNEVLIKGWDKYAPEKIPLLGFFYVDVKSKLTPSGDIYIVQKNQLDFYKKTHLFAPVIRITGDSWMNVSFRYVESDQSTKIPDVTDVVVDKNSMAILSHPHK
ncbi:TPA: hypothetical protein QCI16_005035 [Enterobacter ludwigii]|uniref:hypothetical protein n=1 Tax=Enterobacter ludwigii TaxID=299767 RepID=UPI002FD0CE49|nr:hypothetical protein [Enterobacter ludwigii]HDR2600784.1 hypothetical protein [Enterobacter ludwigii]